MSDGGGMFNSLIIKFNGMSTQMFSDRHLESFRKYSHEYSEPSTSSLEPMQPIWATFRPTVFTITPNIFRTGQMMADGDDRRTFCWCFPWPFSNRRGPRRTVTIESSSGELPVVDEQPRPYPVQQNIQHPQNAGPSASVQPEPQPSPNPGNPQGSAPAPAPAEAPESAPGPAPAPVEEPTPVSKPDEEQGPAPAPKRVPKSNSAPKMDLLKVPKRHANVNPPPQQNPAPRREPVPVQEPAPSPAPAPVAEPDAVPDPAPVQEQDMEQKPAPEQAPERRARRNSENQKSQKPIRPPTPPRGWSLERQKEKKREKEAKAKAEAEAVATAAVKAAVEAAVKAAAKAEAEAAAKAEAATEAASSLNQLEAVSSNRPGSSSSNPPTLQPRTIMVGPKKPVEKQRVIYKD